MGRHSDGAAGLQVGRGGVQLMPRSPFQIAFDHYDECAECNYGERRLCPDGRALFKKAHDTCVMLASPEPPETNNQA